MNIEIRGRANLKAKVGSGKSRIVKAIKDTYTIEGEKKRRTQERKQGPLLGGAIEFIVRINI